MLEKIEAYNQKSISKRGLTALHCQAEQLSQDCLGRKVFVDNSCKQVVNNNFTIFGYFLVLEECRKLKDCKQVVVLL